MASKRARSSGGTRSAFGHVDLVDDDDRQRPGLQSQADEASPERQAAGPPVQPAGTCPFCSEFGRHDPACIFAGRAAERALMAARRRDGLA